MVKARFEINAMNQTGPVSAVTARERGDFISTSQKHRQSAGIPWDTAASAANTP